MSANASKPRILRVPLNRYPGGIEILTRGSSLPRSEKEVLRPFGNPLSASGRGSLIDRQKASKNFWNVTGPHQHRNNFHWGLQH